MCVLENALCYATAVARRDHVETRGCVHVGVLREGCATGRDLAVESLNGCGLHVCGRGRRGLCDGDDGDGDHGDYGDQGDCGVHHDDHDVHGKIVLGKVLESDESHAAFPDGRRSL